MKLFDVNLEKGKIKEIVEAISYFYNQGDFEQLAGHSVIHVKDALLKALEERGIGQKQLEEKGLIFDLDVLKKKISEYQSGDHSSLYKTTYLKRMRLGLNNIIVFFDRKKLQNADLIRRFNNELGRYMFKDWHSDELPEALMTLVNTNVAEINAKIKKNWNEKQLPEMHTKELDKVAEDALWLKWKMTKSSEIKFSQTIDTIKSRCILDKFLKEKLPQEFSETLTKAIQEEFYDLAMSGNSGEVFKKMVKKEIEKDDGLPGPLMAFYKKIASNVLSKWRDKKLSKKEQQFMNDLVSAKIKKLSLPGELHSDINRAAIKAMLQDYKVGALQVEIAQELRCIVEGAIDAYLSKRTYGKESICHSRNQVIAIYVIEALNSGELSQESASYIREHSLTDLRVSLKQLVEKLDIVNLTTKVDVLNEKLSVSMQAFEVLRQKFEILMQKYEALNEPKKAVEVEKGKEKNKGKETESDKEFKEVLHEEIEVIAHRHGFFTTQPSTSSNVSSMNGASDRSSEGLKFSLLR